MWFINIINNNKFKHINPFVRYVLGIAGFLYGTFKYIAKWRFRAFNFKVYVSYFVASFLSRKWL